MQVVQAVRFADKYANAWYDLPRLGLDGMRQVFEHVPHDRIKYGTDWPFYHAKAQFLTTGVPPRWRPLAAQTPLPM
mgnify:CR=1 FL=1